MLLKRKMYLHEMVRKQFGYIFFGKHNCDRQCVAYIATELDPSERLKVAFHHIIKSL
jgi:hypothetical protein